MPTTEQIVDLIIWLTLQPYPIFMILMYKNRSFYPIKGRFPRIGLLQACFVYGFCTISFLFVMLGYPCEIYNIVLFTCTAGAQDTLNFRLFQLLFAYEVTQNISDLKDNRNFKEWKLNWFTQNRHYFQDKYQIRIAILLILIRVILVSIVASLPESICTSASWSLLYAAVGGGMSLVSLIIALKMWKYPRDAFGIKKEFAFQVYGSFLNILVFYCVSVISTDLKWVVNSGILASGHTVLFFIVVPPYFDSVKFLKRTDYLSETKSLELWLKRPEGIRIFLEYLKTEFSQENLLFYLDVIYFKSLPWSEPSRLKDEIGHVYQKFISRESPLALNLPDEVIEITGNAVQQIMATPIEDFEKIGKDEIFGVYDRAQKEIYILMASDSFHRFQQSSKFLKVKDELARGNSVSGDSKSDLDQLLGKEDAALGAVNVIREENPGTRETPSRGGEAPSRGGETPSRGGGEASSRGENDYDGVKADLSLQIGEPITPKKEDMVEIIPS